MSLFQNRWLRFPGNRQRQQYLTTVLHWLYTVTMSTQIEPFYQTLGSKIQQTREKRKMTQAQLGMSLNPPSTRASIANIENGKQRVLAHTLAQLADALGVKIQTLVPTSNRPAQVANPKDVELELKRKLNLAGPQLEKLAASLSATNSGRRS